MLDERHPAWAAYAGCSLNTGMPAFILSVDIAVIVRSSKNRQLRQHYIVEHKSVYLYSCLTINQRTVP